MKIAMLGQKRIPSREGGIEIVVEELAERMTEKGHDVTVYNRRGRHVSDKTQNTGKKPEKYDYKGIHIVTVPTFEKKSLNAVVYAFLATWKAVFSRFDVIHYHAEGPCAMLPIAKLFGQRTVATIHGLDWQRAKWGGFATRFLRFGEKMAAKYADEVIVLSRGVQQYFMEQYGRGTKYIPNGVTQPEKRPANVITEKYGLKGNDYILFLARLVPEKGLHYLIEAYAGLNTDKRLVIAGGSSHSDDYIRQIEAMAAKDERIIMTGFVEGQELEELYSNCLLYVLPSDVEGMPISLLEAMSYGCRCLVSDIAENREVVEDMAVSFRKSDTADLREKLGRILQEIKEPNAVGESGINRYSPEEIQNFVLTHYDWDAIVERTLQLYA